MNEILLLKDGEIVLKGLNRRSFEDVLKKNLKHALKSAGHFEITSAQSTIYVKPLAKSFQGCSELSLFQEPPFVKKQSNQFLKPLRNILKISLKI